MLDIDKTEVATLRAFNRTYTSRMGLLDTRLNKSPFTLSEARILYELANRSDPTGAEIARALGIDPAQISRTLKRFAERGLVQARDNPDHGRHQLWSLTDAGRQTFAALEQDTTAAVGALLDGLPPQRRDRLVDAARAITTIFEDDVPPRPVLRGLQPGDLGRIITRQAVLYHQEYGWNSDFEALIAGILSQFHSSFDPAREAAWIADMDGTMVGSVFLVTGDSPDVAKLRLLYVEPQARGAGVGTMLVAACIQRARQAGYQRLDLWTNSILTAAIAIYERAGFRLVDEAPHHSFGKDLVGQTWSLDL